MRGFEAKTNIQKFMQKKFSQFKFKAVCALASTLLLAAKEKPFSFNSVV